MMRDGWIRHHDGPVAIDHRHRCSIAVSKLETENRYTVRLYSTVPGYVSVQQAAHRLIDRRSVGSANGYCSKFNF
jgi:hypothetical protein